MSVNVIPSENQIKIHEDLLFTTQDRPGTTYQHRKQGLRIKELVLHRVNYEKCVSAYWRL